MSPISVSLEFAESEYERGKREGATGERKRIRRRLAEPIVVIRQHLRPWETGASDAMRAIEAATRAPKRKKGSK